MAKKKPDDPERLIETLTAPVEPPPMARPIVSPPYGSPIPFGAPPAEKVTLVDGEIPWELREER